MYDHARCLSGIGETTSGVVIMTQEGSSRDQVLIDATECLVLQMLGGDVVCEDQNRILTGPKGMGKTYILMAIARICALLEFANPDWTIACAYASVPVLRKVLLGPTSYIVRALYDRGLLQGEDGNPPPWAFEPKPSRVSDMLSWCRSKKIIPALLLDEAAEIRHVEDDYKLLNFKTELR